MFKEWLYFSSLLSQESIDFPKIEKYVDGLTVPMQAPEPLTLQSEIKGGSFESGFMRKKQEIVDRYKQQNSNGGSLLLGGLVSQYKTPFQLPLLLDEQPTISAVSCLPSS